MTTDLIKRLTEATEGSRELDCIVAFIAKKDFIVEAHEIERTAAEWTVYEKLKNEEGDLEDSCIADYAGVPHYTTSLDAAMTLVPEGWRIMMLAEYYGKWSACLHRAFGIAQDNAIWKSGHHWPSEYSVNGETNSNLALALCISALKAKDQS